MITTSVERKTVSSHSTQIVPTLCVGMPPWTLCVLFVTRSVTGCIPTQSVGTIRIREYVRAASGL
ncbi:hypothetical protein FPT12_01575 [Pseudomonas sp. H3(2019)]|nr:hypothetical protein FPT12_01575 [Pseudomonas sp. H3(2019)]